jgi:hypothetical protein
MKHSSSFYYDLDFAEKAEDWVNGIFTGGYKIEVKCDRMAHHTHNIYIELYSRGKPSGISTTQADYWIFIIYGRAVSVILPTNKIKELCKEIFNGTYVYGGDNNTSKGILIPLNLIL